ncbi:MAG: hypothetical protein QM756_16855 [Polyangiaceae bacterium]
MVPLEYVGFVFWFAVIVLVPTASTALVVLFHCVGAVLSFLLPVLAARAAARLPADELFGVCWMGMLNGLLGVAWCVRIGRPLSKWPMLGLMLAGLVVSQVLLRDSATPTRLF